MNTYTIRSTETEQTKMHEPVERWQQYNYKREIT